MHRATDPIYVLEDATGYVTACPATPEGLSAEVSRRPLVAPIRVFHWHLKALQWNLARSFTWEAAGSTWF